MQEEKEESKDTLLQVNKTLELVIVAIHSDEELNLVYRDFAERRGCRGREPLCGICGIPRQ